MNAFLIYRITNKTTGMSYVGQTTRPIHHRIAEHKYCGSCIGKAISELGIESFSIDVIDTANSIGELDEKEKFWIAELNTLYPNGYNKETGGRNAIIDVSGQNNPFYGRRGGNAINARKVVCVETGIIYDCIKTAADDVHCDRSAITKCCKGKSKKVAGYHWKYA